MTLYIPQHLRKIGILGDLCKLIEEYGKKYSVVPGNFDDYQLYMKIDPVKRFINMCHPNPTEDIVNYLTRCFYSVSGTIRVLEFMKKDGYLPELVLEEYKYTVDLLYLRFRNLSTNFDEGIFYDNLREFLNALLYFGKLKVDIDDLTINLEGELNSHLYPGIKCYGYYQL